MTNLKDRYYKRNQPHYPQEPPQQDLGEEEYYQQPYQQPYEQHQDEPEDYRQPFFQQPVVPQRRQREEIPYPPQQPMYQQEYYDDHQQIEEGPLSILEEISDAPSPKGTFPVMIGGRPIDLHMLEEYVVKISPHSLSTLLRYRNARTIEEIKGYGKGMNVKFNGKTLVMILIAVGMAVLGLIFMLFMPDIMAMFQSGV